VSALSDIVRVSVDGLEVITVQDANPLPQGTFSVAAIGSENLQIDEVNIFITEQASPQRQTGPVALLSILNVTASTSAELITAINDANARCQPPKNDSTTITLTGTSDYVLTAPVISANFPYGANGLPVIRCEITIAGNGKTIRRNSSTKFRIFAVASPGKLKLDNVVIKNGEADAVGGSGVFNFSGQTIITNGGKITENTLTISSSEQVLGAGVYNYNGTLSNINSSFL
jgi:hypothetical protein